MYVIVFFKTVSLIRTTLLTSGHMLLNRYHRSLIFIFISLHKAQQTTLSDGLCTFQRNSTVSDCHLQTGSPLLTKTAGWINSQSGDHKCLISLSTLITTSYMYLWCQTYFLARRFLVFSSSSDSVDDDGVVLADVLTGEAGGSTFTALPTLGALATLCIEPSPSLAPGGANRLSFVMDDTSIWLTELCLRLRLLSPKVFNTK